MKTYLDCYPCLLRQALDAAQMAGADERQRKAVLDHVLGLLRQVEPSSTPPEIGDQVHRIVRREDDPLEVAIRLSIAGNIIDFGPAREYDLWDVVERVLVQPFATDDRAAFREALARADQVLYLADNAGEAVFDRLLIEILDVPVVYAVKGGPILNDATVEDALAAGVDHVAKIISTGSDAPGTILDLCSEKFHRLYEEAELVIAKGQANYETLSEEGTKVFFLLQIKCPAIARDVGVPVGSVVLKQG